MSVSRLRLMTFDVTNTLLRVKVSPSHQYAEAAKLFGIEIPEKNLQDVYRSTWKKKKEEHPNYGLELGMTTKEWWADFVVRVFTNAGYRGNLEHLKHTTEYLWEQFEKGLNWELLPKSAIVLERLKASGLKLGVVSNFDDRLEKTLGAHKLSQYFDFLVTPIVARAEKPNAAIFEHALKLGGTRPEDAAHVGDDVCNDYLAARDAGMSAFLLHSKGQLTDHVLRHVDRRHVIHDLSQLLTLVLISQKAV